MYEETEDDAVAKFYKQHMVKSKPPGSVTAHKVDTYMAEAITKSFHQMQQRRKEQREKDEDIRLHEQSNSAYVFISVIVFVIALIVGVPKMVHNRKHNAELRRIKLENEKKSSVK